jgi:hypothetical protein
MLILDKLETQISDEIFLHQPTSAMNANAFADGIFAEANIMPASEVWGSTDLDLNDDVDLFRFITE